MKRTLNLIIGSFIALGSLSVARRAAAAEKLTGPSLDTEGKPLNPPAPPITQAPRLGGVSAQAGVALLSLGPLNDRLREVGARDDLPVAYPAIGVQGFGLFNHFLIGGTGAGIVFAPDVDEGGATHASAGGGWGTFDFGYQLLRVNGFLLAPIVSIGGYDLTLTVADQTKKSFNDSLKKAQSTHLTSRGVLGGVSVLAKLIVLGKDAKDSLARTGWALGLRVGAMYGIRVTSIEADGAEITGAPSFAMRGGYAMLQLGGGTW